MSATRDQDAKVRFVFSNLYESFRKGREAARNADVSEARVDGTNPGLSTQDFRRETGRVLHAGQTKPGVNIRPGWTVRPEWAIREYRAVEFLKARRAPRERVPSEAPAVEAPRVIQARRAAPAAVPSTATALRLQAAIAGEAQSAPFQSLRHNLESLERIQKRLGFLIREIETLSKGSRREDDRE